MQEFQATDQPCDRCKRVAIGDRSDLARYLQKEIETVGRTGTNILEKVINTYHKQTVGDQKDDCCSCIKETIQFLLNRGADINALSWTYNTPLMTAVKLSMYRLCRYLLSVGADPNIGIFGMLPHEVACQRDDYRMVELLLAAGANEIGRAHV